MTKEVATLQPRMDKSFRLVRLWFCSDGQTAPARIGKHREQAIRTSLWLDSFQGPKGAFRTSDGKRTATAEDGSFPHIVSAHHKPLSFTGMLIGGEEARTSDVTALKRRE